jgi:acyl-CoA synthetase (AMP-forming)/AMP-acid ligase II
VPMILSDTIHRLRAIYVAGEGGPAPTPEALRRFLRERLSPNKVPRVIERAESLPKSSTGKILRDEL